MRKKPKKPKEPYVKTLDELRQMRAERIERIIVSNDLFATVCEWCDEGIMWVFQWGFRPGLGWTLQAVWPEVEQGELTL